MTSSSVTYSPRDRRRTTCSTTRATRIPGSSGMPECRFVFDLAMPHSNQLGSRSRPDCAYTIQFENAKTPNRTRQKPPNFSQPVELRYRLALRIRMRRRAKPRRQSPYTARSVRPIFAAASATGRPSICTSCTAFRYCSGRSRRAAWTAAIASWRATDWLGVFRGPASALNKATVESSKRCPPALTMCSPPPRFSARWRRAMLRRRFRAIVATHR